MLISDLTSVEQKLHGDVPKLFTDSHSNRSRESPRCEPALPKSGSPYSTCQTGFNVSDRNSERTPWPFRSLRSTLPETIMEVDNHLFLEENGLSRGHVPRNITIV